MAALITNTKGQIIRKNSKSHKPSVVVADDPTTTFFVVVAKIKINYIK